MKIYFASALLLLCYAVVAADPVICPPNAEFSVCVNPCNDCVIKGNCQFFACNEGCDCIKGYHLDKDRNCIPESQCPNCQGQYEEYSSCVSPCNTCWEKGNCTVAECEYGCDCISGHYRNWEGTCIPESECPKCGENEVYTVCGKSCEPTCENPEPEFCTADCSSGCICKEGLLRNKDGDGECVTPHQCPPSKSPTCEQPRVKGTCDGYFPRFYYNSRSGQCEEFIYGGCDGNKNNFQTKEECDETCELPMCEQPPVTGPCDGAFRRFYYNPTMGQCEEFSYGGCGGNKNNFQTAEECEGTCGRGLPTCEQPPVTGPCYGAFWRFYYNPKSGKCEQFLYGGCHGNDNNFETKEECERTCGLLLFKTDHIFT